MEDLARDRKMEFENEARENESHDWSMRNDYDYFIGQWDDLIQDIKDSLKELEGKFEEWGWVFDRDEVLDD